MPSIGVSIRKTKGAAEKKPNAPADLAVTSTTSTSLSLSWKTPTIPAGGTALSAINVYRNGTQIRTLLPTRTVVTITGLDPGGTYFMEVAGVNTGPTGGEGARSSIEVALPGLGDPPSTPTGLALVGTAGQTTVTMSWNASTPDPTAGLVGYKIYQAGLSGSIKTVGSTITQTQVGQLDPGQSYTFTVRSYNIIDGVDRESADSNSLSVTTANPTADPSVRRSEEIRGYSLCNTKFFYANIYGYNGGVSTNWDNTDACITHISNLKVALVRETPNTAGSTTSSQSARGRQRRAVLGLWNLTPKVRWHWTIGKLAGLHNGVNVTAMSKAAFTAYAKEDVALKLAELAGYVEAGSGYQLPGITDASQAFQSFAGPNEVDAAQNGTNWVRNAHILQRELWEQARLGRDVPEYASLFANVKIYCFSSGGDWDTDIAPRDKVVNYTDASISTAEYPQVPLVRNWAEGANPHMYNRGRTPSNSLENMLNAWKPIIDWTDPANQPTIISEQGYNNAGYALEGTQEWISTQVQEGMPTPEWVDAVYLVKAVLENARVFSIYGKFELLDDPDDPFANNLGDQLLERQFHFGYLAMDQPSDGSGNYTVTGNPPSSWRRKPSYQSVARTNNLLYDSANNALTFTTTALGYSIAGGGGAGVSLRRLLTQKANGRHQLWLWRDLDVWAPDRATGGSATPLTPVTLTITSTAAKTVNRYQPNKKSSDAATQGAGLTAAIEQTYNVSAGGTFQVSLGNDAICLEFI